MLKEKMNFSSLPCIENCLIKVTSSQNPMSQPYHEKSIGQIPVEGHFTKIN